MPEWLMITDLLTPNTREGSCHEDSDCPPGMADGAGNP